MVSGASVGEYLIPNILKELGFVRRHLLMRFWEDYINPPQKPLFKKSHAFTSICSLVMRAAANKPNINIVAVNDPFIPVEYMVCIVVSLLLVRTHTVILTIYFSNFTPLPSPKTNKN
jgi:hypothetical protein